VGLLLSEEDFPRLSGTWTDFAGPWLLEFQ